MSSSGETDGLLDTETASEGGPDLEPEEMRETSAAHAFMHSPLYIASNILMCLIATGLVAWVAVDEQHHPTHWSFFALEVVVTLAIVVEVSMDAAYQGCGSFWLPRTGGDGDGGVNCLLLLWNWFQALVAVACVAALPFFFVGTSEEEELDSVFSLVLLVGRYLVYITVLVGLQYRAVSRSGGLDALTGAQRKDWDVVMEDG